MPDPENARAPQQPDMFADREPDPAPADPRPLSGAKGTRALERLRDRILLASRELKRLREENAALQQQVEELRSRTLGPAEGTSIVFTETPAALRAKVDTFIDAIDQYLERASSGEREAAS